MSDLKNILRDVGYFGVGAAAVILEAGGKAVKALVRKGEKTLQDNQDTVDEIKRKAKATGSKIRDAVQDLKKKDEADFPEVETPEVDLPEVDAPEVPVADVPEAEAPVVPDVIYRTEEPAPAEAEEKIKPEDTVNG